MGTGEPILGARILRHTQCLDLPSQPIDDLNPEALHAKSLSISSHCSMLVCNTIVERPATSAPERDSFTLQKLSKSNIEETKDVLIIQ